MQFNRSMNTIKALTNVLIAHANKIRDLYLAPKLKLYTA